MGSQYGYCSGICGRVRLTMLIAESPTCDGIQLSKLAEGFVKPSSARLQTQLSIWQDRLGQLAVEDREQGKIQFRSPFWSHENGRTIHHFQGSA